MVDEESAHLDALIGEAVEMAELDANVLKVQAAPRHTRTLLEHAVEGSHTALGRHQVTLMVQEPDRPVWFDAKLLGRVFRHLIENAALYSPPESRIALRSRRVEGRLEFEVEDNGSGIDKVDLPHIFEKFYRGKKGAKLGMGQPAWDSPSPAPSCWRTAATLPWKATRKHGCIVPILGAAGGKTNRGEGNGRAWRLIRPPRRSSRIRHRDAAQSFVSPTRVLRATRQASAGGTGASG